MAALAAFSGCFRVSCCLAYSAVKSVVGVLIIGAGGVEANMSLGISEETGCFPHGFPIKNSCRCHPRS